MFTNIPRNFSIASKDIFGNNISLQPTILGIANQKRGVGKTTTCVSLGIGLAQEGKPMLLVNCDPQASPTISLSRALYPSHCPRSWTSHHAEGVDVLSVSIEVSLVNAMSRETVLRQVLDGAKRRYTHILVCPR